MFNLTVCSIFAISRVSGMKLGSHPKNHSAYNKPATGIDELTNARLEMIAETHGVEVSQPLLEWAENPCYAGLVQMVSILPKKLFLAGAAPCKRNKALIPNRFNGRYDLGNVNIFAESACASPFLVVYFKRRKDETSIRFKIYFENVQRHESRVGSFSVRVRSKGNLKKVYEQPLTYAEYQSIVENKAVLFGRAIRLSHADRMARKIASMPALEEVSPQDLAKQFKKYKRDKRNHVFIHDKPIHECLGPKCVSADGRSHLHIVSERDVPMYNDPMRLGCSKCKNHLPYFQDEDGEVYHEDELHVHDS